MNKYSVEERETQRNDGHVVEGPRSDRRVDTFYH